MSQTHLSQPSLTENKARPSRKPKSARKELQDAKIYAAWRKNVSGSLRAAGMRHDADALDQCGKFVGNFSVVVCGSNPGHNPHPVPFHCNLPFCQDCERRSQRRRIERYEHKFRELAKLTRDYVGWGFKALNLTTPYYLGDPNARRQLQGHRRAVKRFLQLYYMHALQYELTPEEKRRGRIDLAKHDIGVLVSDEYGENNHKLHSHLTLNSPYIDQKVISKLWLQATDGVAYVVHVTKIEFDRLDRGIKEQMKYVTKPSSLPAELAPNLLLALSGNKRRSLRIRSYGKLRDISDAPKELSACKVCEERLTRIDLEQYYNICLHRNIAFDEVIVAASADKFRSELAGRHLRFKHHAKVGESPQMPGFEDDLMLQVLDRLRGLTGSGGIYSLFEPQNSTS